MKKSITQLTLLFAFLVMGTFTYAQCTGSVYIRNSSGEDWTVSYYNNDLTVPAGTDATLGFINGNPTVGRGVLRTANPNDCNHKFQTNPDFWVAGCAPSTTAVYYEAVLTPSTGCYNAGRIYIF